MERIWAPWRMTYVSNTAQEEGCIFCRAWDANDDRERLVLLRGGQSLIMLNRYPYTCGHLMAVPARHTAGLDDLSDNELLELMHAVRRACALLREVARPHGFNIGVNLGKAAGAGVEEHLHIHIVPRWSGDTNFMSVTGDVRVIPDGLLESYDRLAAALKAGE
ncbi:MAG: HIT domain-containing protein [Deltaproteobacteria bacterium]|nr:HIT domain-containing protein [Deltaproteobacteria bacterium]